MRPIRPVPPASAASIPIEGLVPLETVPFTRSLELARSEHPEVEVRIDDILSSPVLSDPDFEDALDSWLEYWRGPAARSVPDFLGRMAYFEALVDSSLAAGGLPPSLRYLPFIESGYDPGASSRARAVGMWQFMEATAREWGMEVSPLFDQRRDPVVSTGAAVSFLSELHEEFGSWFWALAAYNAGPNRARRVLRAHGGGGAPNDSLFWALRGRFPSETRAFVPKFIAAAHVAANPEGHGFRPGTAAAFRYDEVTVPDATTLDIVARAASASKLDIERLNPQYVRGITPPGRASTLRVPAGRGEQFAVAYARIPPEERVTLIMHRVAEGETLSHIAIQYGVRVVEIEAANPGIRPRYLQIGRTLTVPLVPGARATGGAGG